MSVEMEKFGELELTIRSMVDEYFVLKKRNNELEKLYEGVHKELEVTKQKLNVMSNEKEKVRLKVDGLLEMLRDIKMPHEGG